MEQKFWRLLGDYERLTRDESVAARECNFDALSAIHDTKPQIFRELTKIGEALGLKGDHPSLRPRLRALADAEQGISAIISEAIAKARQEHQALNSASARLRAFEHVYAQDSHGGKPERRLSAQV